MSWTSMRKIAGSEKFFCPSLPATLHKLVLCHQKTRGEDKNAHCRLCKNIKLFTAHFHILSKQRAALHGRNAIWGKKGFRNRQNKQAKKIKINRNQQGQKTKLFFFSSASVCHEKWASTGFGEKRGRRRRRRKTTRIASFFSLFETGLSTPGNGVSFPRTVSRTITSTTSQGQTQLVPSSLSRQSRDGGVYIHGSC